MNFLGISPISSPLSNWSPLPLTFVFSVWATCCSLSVTSQLFDTGTFRYMPKHSFGSLYDGGRPHLPRSASTFFASHFDDRTANGLMDAMPDYLRTTGGATAPHLSGVRQLFSAESTAPADETAQIGGTELKQKNTRSTNLLEFDDQKGQFARKNCFFSPLQCSFYYKKRSHHRRNAPLGVILASGKVIGSEVLRSRPLM
ncbi:hypothetical protein niasHT_020766 [Heterodera trifolii]|uniref:Uncharacterized protein n=1 Tax=Heterodera trifolii TaxID=157864 RepID=A0ABD2KEU0_9BILA